MRMLSLTPSKRFVEILMQNGVTLPEIAEALSTREYFVWKTAICRRELSEKQCGLLVELAERERIDAESLEALRVLANRTKSEVGAEE